MSETKTGTCSTAPHMIKGIFRTALKNEIRETCQLDLPRQYLSLN